MTYLLVQLAVGRVPHPPLVCSDQQDQTGLDERTQRAPHRNSLQKVGPRCVSAAIPQQAWMVFLLPRLRALTDDELTSIRRTVGPGHAGLCRDRTRVRGKERWSSESAQGHIISLLLLSPLLFLRITSLDVFCKKVRAS